MSQKELSAFVERVLCLVLGVAVFFAFTTPVFATLQAINIGNGTEPQDLDPHVVTGVPEHHIIAELFEGLVTVDPQTLEPLPAAAESWTKSKDGRVYTFLLRKNAKWSNGDPVTAHDFVYSWRRLLEPKTASQYAYQGYYIKNGEKFNTGKLKDASKLGVKARDAHTLEVTLENPTPFFLGLLYHFSLYPVSRKAIEAYGQKWTKPEHMISNGPFTLVKWEMNKIITLKKNPLYWDQSNVKLSEINFYPIENPQSEEMMFRAGRLHVTTGIPLEKVPMWQGDKSGVYQEHPYFGTYYYRFNVTKKPFNDKRVRRALAITIDRERIVKYVTREGQLPATAFTPPGTAGFYPKARLPGRVDANTIVEARSLLKDAGYPAGKGFPTVEILYNTSDAHKKIAEAIQQMWKQSLGIDVKLFNQEWKVYLSSTRTLAYQIARAGWIGDYNDPNTFLDMFVTNGGNNETGWSNKEYDQTIAEVAAVEDRNERNRLFQRAESILLDELPIIPIYVYTRGYLKSKAVTGWYPNVQDYHPLKFVSLR